MIRAGAAGKILETPRLSFVNGYHVRLVTQRTRACDRQRACKVKSSAVVEGEEQRMLRFFADSVKTVTLAAACTSIAVKRDAVSDRKTTKTFENGDRTRHCDMF
mmetsp:Transcript_15939/g.65269  ORF Transcript_15939/g.65269 Transcript_15939/m.65269 type:complete len:104 (-) Transcript_15939:4744-5055(-)